MAKWQCSICGFIYDPAGPDSTGDFESLPDSWFCPSCGVGKEFFNKIE
ncbi:MAG: rubredoxin [Syntrophobacteraceae bacterium]|nr:rubredoxin [Syntrophobacteraceae bacterium]